MQSRPVELSEDHFLGGRVKIRQPLAGYRAATDPVLLAAAVPARPGQSVLDLGCGVGVASLCLGRRVAGLSQTGVELQADYAALARENAAANGIALQVVEADITALPVALRAGAYDHVMANPPWFAADAPGAQDSGRDFAQREALPLAEWVDVGLRRLRPGGYLCLIHLAERLPKLLGALDGRASAMVRPLAAREGRAAGRVIVLARKGARAPFGLLAPLVLHRGARHEGDFDHFTARATAILRDGEALGWHALA